MFTAGPPRSIGGEALERRVGPMMLMMLRGMVPCGWVAGPAPPTGGVRQWRGLAWRQHADRAMSGDAPWHSAPLARDEGAVA